MFYIATGMDQSLSLNMKGWSFLRSWIDRRIKWVFTLPAILFIAIMIVYPLLYTFRLSFFSSSMSSINSEKWVGFTNYVKMFSNGKFLKACWITLIYSSVCLIFQTFFGVSIAIFMNREFRGRGLTRTLSLLPHIATPVAIAMVWKMMYDPGLGFINFILTKFNVAPIAFLGNPSTALASIMLIDIWQHTPTIMLICMGGLSGIPYDVMEAAQIDGASSWQSLRRITLPLLSPTIMSAALLRLIDLLKTYDIIYSTTQGGPGTSTQTINVIAYRQAFENFKFGEASATITVFFVVLVLMVVLFNKLRKKMVVDY